LSLTPVPVDFGNLYAENVSWGIAYTGAQLALGGAMMWMGGSRMCHGACGDWSDTDRNAIVGFAAGYVLVKLVAGVHAASAASAFNEAHRPAGQPILVPAREGALLGWGVRF
jgi:hypothetical protein